MSLDNLFKDSQFAGLKFDANGLIPTVVQSADSHRVLMMAWMNKESIALSLEKGETVFYSRSRQELWHKGATSGNTQKLVSLQADCDGDTLLAIVHEAGPACHNGTESCFDTVELFTANQTDE
jgi:phosphoribosyl-AMP cyclohydrolase/phosphoribosyl-ATP pyrophosphohydrolase/phosphoribosyl-AMP cyclohydrolase